MAELTVRELREKTGMSQARFAERFDISVRTLQGWESGKGPVKGMVSMMARIIELEEENRRLKNMIAEQKKE